MLYIYIFTGTIDVSNLPDTLVGFSVTSNQFSELITDGFKNKTNLIELYLTNNRITHENINFQHFTNNMKYLSLSNNNISGTIDNLPNSLYEFLCTNCNLTSLIWSSNTFGTNLRKFGIANNINGINSSIDMSFLSSCNNLKYFYAQNNDYIYGNVDLSYLPSSII